FDLFADALSQRSEPDTGIWLAGLDAVARDALEMPGVYEAPPVICYLDRGAGAAIRRARTRLPGGGDNPVAIIRMPRERMIGSGIASSLVHEVGHQGSALLRLVPSLTTVLGGLKRGRDAAAWALWARWTSEILADLWAVAKVGIASTMGLIAVVSLPRAFVFRITADDPHPSPWMRVLLSCALGSALYPHPQWDRLASLWRSLYPAEGLKGEAKGLFSMLEATMPSLVTLVVNHRPPSLGGASLGEVLASPDREPARLAWLFQTFRASPGAMRETAPSLVFAAVGQAKADGLLGAEGESRLLSNLLKYWALRCALGGARRSTTEATAFVALSSH
ncbi:MAG: hypothetical protein L6Q76_19370, partial [Polyangiaceae bacterium]|nr:hypothetical protein [Polyangiaceae bacterium]